MQAEAGMIVWSASGHDADSFYVVVSVEPGYVRLADGKLRPLEKPKRKNMRHIRKTGTRLDLAGLTTNRKLREALSAYRNAEGGIQFVEGRCH